MKKVYKIIIVLLLIFIWLGPVFYKVDPTKQDLRNIESKPSVEHLLGTDGLGRDVIIRLMHGGQKSVVISFTSTVIKVALSLVLAFIASSGKRFEKIIMSSKQKDLPFILSSIFHSSNKNLKTPESFASQN